MTEARPSPPKVIDINATRPGTNDMFGVYAMSVNENEQWAIPSDDSPLDEERVAQWERRGERIRRVSARVLILRNCIGYRETSDGFHGASHVNVFYVGCNVQSQGRFIPTSPERDCWKQKTS
jgi:hypothetical protein